MADRFDEAAARFVMPLRLEVPHEVAEGVQRMLAQSYRDTHNAALEVVKVQANKMAGTARIHHGVYDPDRAMELNEEAFIRYIDELRERKP